MKFTECKGLQIINCDYEKIRARKAEIESKNKAIAKANKRAGARATFCIVLLTIVTVIMACFALTFLQQTIRFNIQEGPFFTKFEEIDPDWVKMAIEIVVLLLFASAYHIILTSIVATSNSRKKKPEPMTEQIHFAMVTEGNTIGNIVYSKNIDQKAPYMRQQTSISFDAINPSETEYYSFASAKKWYTAFIPGLFNTIIDVEGMMIYQPCPLKEEVDTIEGAYLHEKLRTKNLEEQIQKESAENLNKIVALKESLQTAKRENGILENEIVKANHQVEEVKKERDSIQKELIETGALLVAEREKTSKAAIEEKKRLSGIQDERDILKKQLEDATAAEAHMSTAYKEKVAECEALTRRAEQAEKKLRIQEDAAKETQREYEAKTLAELQQCKAQLKEANEKCEAAIQEKETVVANILRKKEDEINQLMQKIESEKVEVQLRYTERLHELEDDLQEAKEKEANMRVVVAQLEHNAKSDREYHQNLEKEYNRLKDEAQINSQQMSQVKAKDREIATLKQAVEEQKATIDNLEERLSMLTTQKERFEKEISESNAAILAFNSEKPQMEEKLARMEDVERQLEALTNESRSLNQSNADLRARNKRLTEELLSEQTHRKEAEDAAQSTAIDLQEVQQKLTSTQNYVTSLESKLDRAYKEAEEAKAEAQRSRSDNSRSEAEGRKKRETEAAEFKRLMKEREEAMMKEREEAVQKAREDAKSAHEN